MLRTLRLSFLVFALGVLAAPVHAQKITFEETSVAAGIRTTLGGTGVSAFDFDMDGWDDITIALNGSGPALFRNNQDGTFTDVAAASGIEGGGYMIVALWADVNRDGLPDLFLGQASGGKSALYINQGDGTFVDMAEEAGIDVDARVGSAAFGDFDENGSVDLFLAINEGPDLLYQNIGGVRFVDVSSLAGVEGPEGSVAMQAAWVDYDLDGDLDLHVVHDGATEPRLHVNKGVLPLTNSAASVGLAHTGVGNSMGVAWGDANGDGLLDLYVTRIGQAGLYVNNGNGHFRDEAELRGADRNGMSWGVVFADFDNDGDEDIFVVSTSGYDGTPTLLYQNFDGQFFEVGAAAGASIQVDSKGLARGDFNNDGLVDLVLTSRTGTHRLLLNTTDQPGNWVKIQIDEPNHSPVLGARVEILAGGRTLIRYISGGDSYCSQPSAILHFGIGDVSFVESVVVTGRHGSSYSTGILSANYIHHFPTSAVADAIGDENVLPETAILEQNYPNPFNTETTIAFELPARSHVRLVVTDLLGREIATLIDELRSAGRHEVVFNALDLPGGQYLYRLESLTHVRTRVLSLVR